MGFFSSLFSLSNEKDEQKENQRKFDILKHDGMRALNYRKVDYAVKCFTEALKIETDFETMNYLVSAYMMLNEMEKALEVVNQMISENNEILNTLLLRVNILFNLEKFDDANNDCEKILDLEPDNYAALFYRGKIEKSLGNYQKSIDYFTRAIEAKDDFTEALMQRSEVFLSVNNGNDALNDINTVISKNPENESAFTLRGKIHVFLNNSESALNDFRHVIELNPFNEEVYLTIANLLINENKYTEARSVLTEGIDEIECFYEAYKLRSFVNEKIGDLTEAAEDMDMYNELDDDDFDEEETDKQGFDYINKNII